MAVTYLAISLLLVIFYVYVGYPLLLKIASINQPRALEEQSSSNLKNVWPRVSVVVTAHNAAHLISGKLSNLAAVQYPGELDVNFVLDGCTDSTSESIKLNSRQVPWQIHVIETDQRNGKEAAIRHALPSLRGDVLMFSDADAEMKPDTVLELVKKLNEPGVGVACGREWHLSRNKGSAGEGQGLFYRYEDYIKQMQEKCTSLCYVQGGVFAMWKELYPKEIPVGCTQDGVIAFDVVLQGKRVAFQPSAVSQEYYDLGMQADFSRRIRTVSRAFYSVWCRRQIFNPLRTGWYGIHVLSARVLRWLVFPLALTSLVMLIAAANMGDRLATIGLFCFFAWTLATLVGFLMEVFGKRIPILYFPFYFTYIHIAAMLGVLRVLFGKRTATWTPTC
jgi:cellulose synthase/poly-beta-1,6-N-acetylglucosamine synthase-like glycosyltransferase